MSIKIDNSKHAKDIVAFIICKVLREYIEEVIKVCDYKSSVSKAICN